MKTEKINVRGVLVDNVNLDEATEVTHGFLAEECVHPVYTPNAEIVQACIEDPSLCELINSASLVIPDGAGVVLGAKIIGTPLKAKTPGYDLGLRIAEYAANENIPIFFLGGKPGVAEAAYEKLKETYPGLNVVAMHDGYFKKEGEENDAVTAQIAASGAKILYVCLGAPTQEKWIRANIDRLGDVRVALGLGGSFDGYAGIVKRAPKIFIKLRLEWFYRLCKEPRRIGRMMKLPKFVFGTLFAKIRGKV